MMQKNDAITKSNFAKAVPTIVRHFFKSIVFSSYAITDTSKTFR